MAWLSADSNYMIVAEHESRVCGVALLKRSGEMNLFYLLPEAKSQGIGHALLAALEGQAVRWGTPEIFLKSTAAAQSFYRKHGYKPTGSAIRVLGNLSAVPFSKTID